MYMYTDRLLLAFMNQNRISRCTVNDEKLIHQYIPSIDLIFPASLPSISIL